MGHDPMTRDVAQLRVLCIAGAPERAEAIEAISRVLVPGAQISHASTPDLAGARPMPDVAIVDGDSVIPTEEPGGTETVRAEVEAVRRLRASGFGGEILVLGDAILAPTSTTEEELSRLGAARVSTARLGPSLAEAFVAALQPRSADPGTAQLLAHLARTRQLLSAGEIAIGLQHSMNNPLAAILAESQLLEMDELSPEQREAVGRIVSLCRRMTAVVRRLDGVGGPVGGSAPPDPNR